MMRGGWSLEPEWGIRRDAIGVHSLSRLEDGPVRVNVTEEHLGPTSEPTLRDLSEALITVYGTDYGIHRATWISRPSSGAGRLTPPGPAVGDAPGLIVKKREVCRVQGREGLPVPGSRRPAESAAARAPRRRGYRRRRGHCLGGDSLHRRDFWHWGCLSGAVFWRR
jgi:hypothetical protein